MADRHAHDHALLARIQQNDARALDELLRAYTLKLVSAARHYVHRDDLAEDVVQDVFVSMWEQRHSLAIQGNVAGYLYRAVRNRSLNVARHERSESRVSVVYSGNAMGAVANDGERNVEASDTLAQLEQALKTVPPSPREVFELHWRHELSYEEIATALGIGIPSVRTLMYRATTRLAAYFARRSQN